MKFNFKYQQCGKEKEKPSTTMHSKLGIPLPNLVFITYKCNVPNLVMEYLILSAWWLKVFLFLFHIVDT
jgi:hypothetical protein